VSGTDLIWNLSFIVLIAEFWKSIPTTEPYRVILGDVRDKLYHTRERAHQLLSNGHSDVPVEATFINLEQVSLQLESFNSRL